MEVSENLDFTLATLTLGDPLTIAPPILEPSLFSFMLVHTWIIMVALTSVTLKDDTAIIQHSDIIEPGLQSNELTTFSCVQVFTPIMLRT